MDKLNITHLAKLSQLALSDSERAHVEQDLAHIIDMVDHMASVDTNSVEPLAHPLDAVQRLRPDEVTEEVNRNRFQRGASATEAGLYLVPRVIE